MAFAVAPPLLTPRTSPLSRPTSSASPVSPLPRSRVIPLRTVARATPPLEPKSFSGKLRENVDAVATGAASSQVASPQDEFMPSSPPDADARPLSAQPGWCFGRASVERALDDIAAGKFIVVVDDENRENEGDLIIAADRVDSAAIAFMVRYTSGVICCAMEGKDLDRLQLSPMVANNSDPKNTAFTITCDLKQGTSTGISAEDRAKTLRALADPATLTDDFHRPGHIFPLRYREGGVLKRAGHTEASVDFARLAGCAPVGVLSEIVNDTDGSMARLPELHVFAHRHNLTLTSIADLVMYRRSQEKLVMRVGESPARLPTCYGTFDAYAYRSVLDGVEHIALVMGPDSEGVNPAFKDPVLVRVHSECCTGDVFGSLRCDCGPQLDFAMKEIVQRGRGVLVYLRGQEGRGIGLAHKMRAYALQDQGRDTVQANEDLGLPIDNREYGIGAQILVDLNVSQIILMTNNPAKYSGLHGYGLSIVERLPVQISPNPENETYLRTKQQKMGHWINNLPVPDN